MATLPSEADMIEAEDVAEEVERRVQAILDEEGEDPYSDSDHAMYLRQDILNEVRQERREKEMRINMNFRLQIKGAWGTKKGRGEIDIYDFTKKMIADELPYSIVSAETKGRMSERHMVYTLEFQNKVDFEYARRVLRYMGGK